MLISTYHVKSIIASLMEERHAESSLGWAAPRSRRGFRYRAFPGVVVMLNLRDPGAPPSGGTDGTIVNHVDFVVQNVQESAANPVYLP
jgi:hypothetical protein